MTSDPDFLAWVDRARAVRLEDECARRQLKLSRGHERAGPCPICRDGKDRFAINVRKQLWSCRRCGTGGDVIKLVQMVDGLDFVAACETLVREPPPRGRAMTAEERAEVGARHKRETEKAEAKRREDEKRAADFKERERKRLYDSWSHCLAFAGSPAAAYLAHRGVPMVPPTARLRFWPNAPYFHGQEQDDVGRTVPRVIHRGPAMVAAIVGPDGLFRGLHLTYLDGEPPIKIDLGLDEAGEPLPAKKVRGSKKGNHIVLRHVATPRRLFLGEGNETVLSVWWALAQTGRLRDTDSFRSSVDLGNLGGRAIDRERVQHPTLRVSGKDGRSRPLWVPSANPDLDDPAVTVPEGVEEVVLLGDGDSDPFVTETTIRRAARRIRALYPWVQSVRTAWADADADFNVMLTEPA